MKFLKNSFLIVILFALVQSSFAQNTDAVPNMSKSIGPVISSPNVLGGLLANYNLDSLTPGNVQGFGIVWTGSYYIICEFGANKFFRINQNWSLRDSFVVSGGIGQFRDMVFAKGLLWGVNYTANPGLIIGVDTGSKAVVKTITTSLVGLRGLGWDPVRQAFWVGTNNFSGPCVAVDTNGVAIPGATFAPGSIYGIGYDANPAGPYLVITRDPNPANTTQTRISRYNAGTFAKVDSFTVTVPLQTPIAPATTVSSGGGAEVYTDLIPGKRVCLSMVQSGPDRVILTDMGDLPVPPPTSNVLVITNDSTTPTAQRIADRDTLKKYVAQLVGGTVTYMTKNTTTVFPDLSSYNTIIFQETSFDATAVRSLVAAQRTALMTWLGTGTPSAKKSLIMIGADLGYAYDQAAVAQTDTVFSRSFGGFQYMLDNGAATAPLANVGLNPPGTQYDVMNIGTTSYWPDGCKPISGGVTFNLYKTRVDTVAGVYKINPNWNVVSTFQDPRYFTGAGDGSGETGFKRVLRNMINIVRNNGGVITNVTPLVGIVAEKYSLAQNYPNPFNPTTKINFTIPNNGLVTLKIYDMLGKEVASLVNGQLTQGSYSVDFNASKLSSGIYFYTIQSGNFVDTKKMMLIK